jgi:lipoprotein signal peptidase
MTAPLYRKCPVCSERAGLAGVVEHVRDVRVALTSVGSISQGHRLVYECACGKSFSILSGTRLALFVLSLVVGVGATALGVWADAAILAVAGVAMIVTGVAGLAIDTARRVKSPVVAE